MSSTVVDPDDAQLFDLLARIKEAAAAEARVLRQLDDARRHCAELIDQALATGRVDRRGIDMFCGMRVRKPRGGIRPRGVARQTPADSETMTASDMARTAGVTRSTVSNWKKRYPELFPKPVDDAIPERYHRDAVMPFLAARGYPAVAAD